MPEIVVDESVNYRFVRRLRDFGFSVYSIGEEKSGISDQEVLEVVREKRAVLITEDSDFGEWVFAHHVKGINVVYLRYPPPEEQTVFNSLLEILKKLSMDEVFFAVITPKKIRKRLL